MKGKAFILTLLIIALAITLRAPFLTREFVLEEGLHVKITRAIIATGQPVFYSGEQQEPTSFLERPPGLFLFLAPAMKLFGEGEAPARVTPMIFGVLEITLVIFFGRRLFGKRSYAPLLAGLLMAIHPYLIQTSLQIHFDQAYSFFSTLFLFLALEKILKRKNRWIDHAQLGAVFFLAFSIKYDPTLILLGIVSIVGFFYYKEFLPKFVITIVLSVFSFFAFFYLYTIPVGGAQGFWIPIALIWRVIKTNFLAKFTTINPGQAISLWAGVYFLLIRFLSWVSIPVLLLFFFSLARLAQVKLLKNPKIIFILLWFFLYTTAYLAVGWAGDYPRYFAPVMPAFSLLIGFVVDKQLSKAKSLTTWRKISTSILVTAFLLVLAYPRFLFLDHITGWVPELQAPFFVILSLGILLIIFALKTKLSHSFILPTIIFLSLGQITIQYLHDYKSNYSLTNFYGISGMKESAVFLKEKLNNDKDVIFTFDSVSYYWDGKFFDYNNSTNLLNLTFEELVDVISSNNIAAFVLPKIFHDNLQLITNEYGFDYYSYLSQEYPNRASFGENVPIDVYYR